MGVINLLEQRCRECYACVRACHVKAIKMGIHPRQILEEYCIFCGRCVKECSQGAIFLCDERKKIKELLEKEEVATLLDPAFIVSFAPSKIVSALHRLGFSKVYEATWAVQFLIEEYKKLFKKRRCTISTLCPVVKNIVCKYFPKLVKYLAPLPSIMEVAAKIVEANTQGLSLVYIAPCICYKKEENALIKGVLTFEELKKWFSEEGISLEMLEEEEFDGPVSQLLPRLFPIREGLLKAMGKSADPFQKEIITVHGASHLFSLFKDMEEEKVNVRFVDALFCEGCIDSPFIGSEDSLFLKKEKFMNLVKDGITRYRKKEEWSIPLLRKKYKETPSIFPSISEKKINRILHSMHRYTPKDMLNCGACGYSNCKDKAKAIATGFTDERVCLPFLLEQLGQKRIKASWTLLELLDEATLLFDKRGHLLLANSKAKRLFDLKDEDFGRKCKDFPFSLTCRKKCPLHVRKSILFEEVKIKEEAPPFLRSTYIVLQEGEVIGVFEVFKEKTPVEEVERMKQDFVSNVSHELRTPLTSIKGAVQLLGQEEESFSDTQRTFLQIIKNNTERLIHLVNDLLDLSRLEVGMMHLNKREHELISIINDSIFSVKTLIDEKKIELKVIVKNAPLKVNVDEERIKQVMVNLLSNAIKFNKPQGKVIITLEDLGKNVCVCVEDTGVGIDEEDMEKIFQKFYHAHLPPGFKAGARLGLAITKNIVQSHGGNIWVESKKGVGSKFYFTLPKSEEAQVEGEKKILVVDDEEDIALLLKNHLEQEGYKVFCCHSGEEVIEKAKAIMPHIIILDILLPDVDGFKIIERIRKDPHISHIPIIVLSIVHMKDEGFIFRLGVAEYLTKPLEPRVLLESIRKVEGRLQRKKKRILLVEDDDEQREILKRMVEGEGYTVFEAKDGKEALNLAQKLRPDLLLLDIMLPDMDGYMVIREVKQNKRICTIPIIVITALNFEQERLKALNIGAEKYIRKPFTKEVLLERIKGFLR